MLLDAVTGGLASAAGYGIAQILKNADQYIDDVARAGNYCSFSEDTPVSTKDGFQPIGDIEVGDKVLAYYEETGETGYYPVTATWFHDDPVIIHLTIDGETLETTPEHPFYTADGEWVAAEDLQIGDQLRKADGQYGAVEKIETEHRVQPMYNLTVATAHTYFVGEGAWLVHNACPPYNRSAFGDFDPEVRKFVYKRDEYTCVYCNQRGDDLTLDHIYPAKKIWEDGAWQWTFEQRNAWFNDTSNLATACPTCNSSKGASTVSEWLERLLRRGLR